MYFTEFSNQGWIEALQAAITDKNDISVISISYGNPENDPQGAWTKAGVKLVNQSLEAAKSRGVTICVASGDPGSTETLGGLAKRVSINGRIETDEGLLGEYAYAVVPVEILIA